MREPNVADAAAGDAEPAGGSAEGLLAGSERESRVQGRCVVARSWPSMDKRMLLADRSTRTTTKRQPNAPSAAAILSMSSAANSASTATGLPQGSSPRREPTRPRRGEHSVAMIREDCTPCLSTMSTPMLVAPPPAPPSPARAEKMYCGCIRASPDGETTSPAGAGRGKSPACCIHTLMVKVPSAAPPGAQRTLGGIWT
jgi:hypothetical protein